MTIAVDIMTPEKMVLQTEAESVVVPAFDGELGILPHHAPLLAQLEPGEIRLRRGATVDFFAVSGGFVEVENNRISIFAETAEMAHEIDVERARQSAEKAKEVLRSPAPDLNLAEAEAALRRALARLRVAEAVRRHPQTPGVR